jgi:hypothetical protein
MGVIFCRRKHEEVAAKDNQSLRAAEINGQLAAIQLLC